MTMTVGELIDRLMEVDEGLEVTIVTQPSWPLTHEVSNHHFYTDDKRVYLFEGDESWYSGAEAREWK